MIFEREHHAAFLGLRQARLDSADAPLETLVDRVPPGVAPAAGRALVVCADVLGALQTFARSRRASRPDLAVVAVAGSTGKTSTKDLLAAILAPLGCHANPGSFNNEFGLPLTICNAPTAARVLVTEMGERRPGDLELLCGIAAPSAAVVTNVGFAHAEHLGGPDGVEATMVEVLGSLPADGLAVLNADCPATPRLRVRASAPVVTAGRAVDATVRVVASSVGDDLRPRLDLATPWGPVEDIHLAVLGAHQIQNAALAAAAALHLGVPAAAVRAGLESVAGARWRMELSRSSTGVAVLNDSYNASPAAMESALRSLAELPATRRFAVLGSMLELGAVGPAEHARLGALAADLGIDAVVTVGDGPIDALATAAADGGVAVERVPDAAAAEAHLAARLEPGDAVLVKASRRVGLDRVAAGILGGAS